MKPYYVDDWLTVFHGDARAVMAEMEPESVHCVVTSPPYWGLRDYGTATWEGGDEGCDHKEGTARQDGGRVAIDGFHGSATSSSDKGAMNFRDSCRKCGARRIDAQLGLEPTPEAYVESMVAVFREVRRVLRSDGTVWLNLGASFAGGDRMTGRNDAVRQGKQTGGGFEAGPRTSVGRVSAGASGRSRSPQPERAPAYGSDDTGPLGSSAPGSAYPDLCDGCRAVLSPRTTDTPRPPRVSPLRESPTDRDTELAGSAPASLDASPLDVPVSTTPRSEPPLPGQCSHCGACGACLSVLRSSSRDARECVRKAWLNYPTFKPKDMVPIPWMVAMALQADGWYLRSDIIWSKPNPMPESVTDRPTKSHEYLFLLSKSPRYYFDADAVKERGKPGNGVALVDADRNFDGRREGTVPGKGEAHATGTRTGGNLSRAYAGVDWDVAGRNIRSVWTVATQPYPGAHFATFPRKLIEPCIKAGSPEGGVVLDPFAGSGTTGLVAQSLSRRAVLIDLSMDYLGQLMARNRDIPLGLGA